MSAPPVPLADLGDEVDPANIPLPPSADTSYAADLSFNDLYAPTEPDTERSGADKEDSPALGHGRGGERTNDGATAEHASRELATGEGRSPSPGPELALLKPAPGSLAEHVAGTDDALPTSRDTFEYALIPADGPPIVNAASPRWLFQNLDVQQLIMWDNTPGGKLFATLYGAGGTDHLLDQSLFANVASIRSELIRLTGIESLRVTPPDPATHPTSLNAPPYGFLVHGIQQGDVDRLLAMGFLSTQKISILFFPFAVTYPTIMLNFMFISDKSNDEVRRMVVALLRRPENRSKVLNLVLL